MEKYYIITKYYASTKILTFEKKEEWLENIDEVALDGSRGSGDTFTVGYITEEGYKLDTESYRTTEFKPNKRGGYYCFDTSKLYARKTKSEELPEEEEEEDLIDIENIEKKEQEVGYITIDEVEDTDEEGNEITVYYDDAGEQYETYEEALEFNKPSEYLLI